MQNNLKALRIRAGMTQKEVAEKSGVPQNRVSEYERMDDLSRIYLGNIYSIAQAIGTTLDAVVYPLAELPKDEIVPTIIMEQLAADKEAAEDGDIDAIINNRFI
ncbi:MAG: helix-turn-helix domain-containing protein [Oscillospiraceae bacterium]|nr:helix-turn-helix domain-containing protein [Oscillospiraceae bacterium]